MVGWALCKIVWLPSSTYIWYKDIDITTDLRTLQNLYRLISCIRVNMGSISLQSYSDKKIPTCGVQCRFYCVYTLSLYVALGSKPYRIISRTLFHLLLPLFSTWQIKVQLSFQTLTAQTHPSKHTHAKSLGKSPRQHFFSWKASERKKRKNTGKNTKQKAKTNLKCLIEQGTHNSTHFCLRCTLLTYRTGRKMCAFSCMFVQKNFAYFS